MHSTKTIGFDHKQINYSNQNPYHSSVANYGFKYINRDNIQQIIDTVLRRKQTIRQAELEAKFMKNEMIGDSVLNLSSCVEDIVDDDHSVDEFVINESFEMFADVASDVSGQVSRTVDKPAYKEEETRLHRKRKHSVVESPGLSSDVSESATTTSCNTKKSSNGTKELQKAPENSDFSTSSKSVIHFRTKSDLNEINKCDAASAEMANESKFSQVDQFNAQSIEDEELARLNDEIFQVQHKLLGIIAGFSARIAEIRAKEDQTNVTAAKKPFKKFLSTLPQFLNKTERRLMEFATMTNEIELYPTEYKIKLLDEIRCLYDSMSIKCNSYLNHLKNQNNQKIPPSKLDEMLLCIGQLTKFYVENFTEYTNDVDVAHCLYVKVKNFICNLRVLEQEVDLLQRQAIKTVQFKNNKNRDATNLEVKHKPKDNLSMYATSGLAKAKGKKSKTRKQNNSAPIPKRTKPNLPKDCEKSTKIIKKPGEINQNAINCQKRSKVVAEQSSNRLKLKKLNNSQEPPRFSNGQSEFVTKEQLFNVLKPLVASFINDQRCTVVPDQLGDSKKLQAYRPMIENESVVLECIPETTSSSQNNESNTEIQDKIVAFAKNVQYRHIISNTGDKIEDSIKNQYVDELIGERNKFFALRHKNPLYKNKKFQSPWKVMTHVADSISSELFDVTIKIKQ